MNQYPNSIIVTVYAAATQDESTGKWTKGATTVYIMTCRAEVNGSGRKIVGKDGVLTDFSFTVYLPKMSTVIPTDSEFILMDQPSEVIVGDESITLDNTTITIDSDLITIDSISVNTDVAVEMARGKLKRASNGQLNSRLWL